ncbi:MAG TPA: ATP-binding protein [Streptosporangiaceae bacterium]|nr:ATP-binding protein [Streptosporangiaceae bacterium]
MTGAYPVLHVGSFGSADPTSRVRPTRPWARTFRGTPASVPEARRFVAELLAGCPACEVLMTCVSELCANAIAHTDSGGGVFIVEVSLPQPGVARVAVTDEGSASVPVAGSLDLMAEGGRGLAMVAACTSRWGYADAHPGRVVWAEACWPVLVSPPPRQDAAGPPAPDTSVSPGADGPRSPAADAPAKRSRRPRLRFPRSSRVPPDKSSRVPPDNWPSGPAA